MSKTTNEMMVELNSIIVEMERIAKENKKNFNYLSGLTINANQLIGKIIANIKYLDNTPDTILLPPTTIVKLVQDKFKVQISAKTRKKEYVNARHIACYFLKKFTRMHLADIADFVGITDHTSVLHGINNVKKFMSLEPEYLDSVFELEERLVNIYKEKYASNNIPRTESNRQAVLQ